MAAVTFTPASVAWVSGARRFRRSGEALVKGAVYYVKSSDGRIYNAACNGTAEVASARGITLSEANAAGEMIECVEGQGVVDVGTVLTVGTDLYLSATAGKLAPRADLTNPNRIVFGGCPKTTSRLAFCFVNAEAVVPA